MSVRVKLRSFGISAAHPLPHGLKEAVEVLPGKLLHRLRSALLRQQSLLPPLLPLHCLPRATPLPPLPPFSPFQRCRLCFERFLVGLGGKGANAGLPLEELREKLIAGWLVGLHAEVDTAEVKLPEGANGGEGAGRADVREVQRQRLLAAFLRAHLHLIKLQAGQGQGWLDRTDSAITAIQVLMASELRLKRLGNEYEEALEAMEDEDEEKVEPSIRAVLLGGSNGAKDLGEWTVIFEGKDFTSLEGGNYKLRVRAGEAYPYEPPEVWMVDGFEHFHVFAGGKVCFKLLNKENWKLGYSILMLVNSIIKMLHSDPEVSDPASSSLPRLIERGETRYHQPNLNGYNAFLKAQAKRFANRYEVEIKVFCKENGIKPREHDLRGRLIDEE